MKTTTYVFLIILAFINSDNSVLFKNVVIHEKAELGKVCQTASGDNIIISKKTGQDVTVVSRLDDGGNFIYHESKINVGYTGNAQIMESKISNGDDGFILYHKSSGKEFFRQFEDKDNKAELLIDYKKEYTSYSEQASAFTLSNGKIFFSGIIKPPSDYAQTIFNLRIYDPQTNSDLAGKNIIAYSKYISCYEQNDNGVYCVYVYEQDPLKSLLGIQYFKVTDAGIVQESAPYLIKAFYSEFNFVKAVKFSHDEVIMVFQTGNPSNTVDIPYGNTGKDLFYYHLKVTPDSMKVIRYDYIYNQCRYRTNAEDYHLDIMPLSDTTSMIVCELENGGNSYSKALKGYKITKNVKKIEYIDFTKFEEKGIKNPQLVKFDKIIGILYTQIYKDDTTSVNLLNMNYPDCEDGNRELKYYGICPANKQTNYLSSLIKLFLNNPYPSSMANEKLYYRFVDTNDMVIKNGNITLELNKDYEIEKTKDLVITENTKVGNSFIAYTAIRKDDTHGDIIGRTCKINVDYPDCLEQCRGCDDEGDEKNNHCFDCKDGYYHVPLTNDTTGCGIKSKIYNCPKCDVACTLCTGPLDLTKPTTNCKPLKCNFDADYFPFEDDTKICFNVTEKEKWEKLLKLNQVLFLDKSKSNNKEDWIWRKCHPRCGECFAQGDDTNNNCTKCRQDEKYNFFFFCNQTKENGGIPGPCHETCEGNGCYKSKEDDGNTKMCPCLPHCKTCEGPQVCQECRETWLLPPEQTSCNKSCAYCLTPYFEDPKNFAKGRCVNCATDFDPPQYTYNNKCYTEENRPYFNYTEYGNGDLETYIVKKLYHVIDDKCNMLTACKRGCKKCSVEKTDLCTECEKDYYKEDPFNIVRKTFKCFSKETCQGLVQYPHDREEKVGGVPIIENDEKICLNCRQRNESYRLPSKFYCDVKINRTYVEIEKYNKLSDCYLRCKECDTGGVAYAMNCITCRDGKFYDLIKYAKNYGNCYRKQHKCGVFPYYHNYDIAVNEDECGEDCDVCLYNFQCPKEFPYFKYETHECIEFCPVTDVLGGLCNVTSNAALIILMKNPFGLKHPYNFLNETVYVDQILSSSLFQYICSTYNCDANAISKDINNYVGHGNVYNIPEPKFIVGNNMTIEISSVKLELEKLAEYLKGETTSDPNKPKTSALDLSKCQEILKKKYGLPEEEELIVIKADILQEFNLTDIIPDTQYQLFSTSIGAFLPLNDCKEQGTDTIVTNPFTSSTYDLLGWLTSTQSKTAAVIVNGYDVFNANSPFYNDVCTPFTNENGNDVLLDARRTDYFNEYVNLCNSECTFIGYNTASKTYTCRCPIKDGEESDNENNNNKEQENIIEKSMPENFKDLISRRSNIAVFKCSSQVFSAEGQRKNFGSYILLVGLALIICVIVYYFVKEKKTALDKLYDDLKPIKHPANPPGKDSDKKDKKDKKEDKKDKKENKKEDKKDKDKKDKDKSKEKENKIKLTKSDIITSKVMIKQGKVKKDDVYDDEQFNNAPFDYSLNKDIRSYLSIYWSYLKFKQLIIFTFFTTSAGILRSSKIVLFILFVSFYMTFTALFFSDNIMRSLYIYKGNSDAAVHIPNIILSSICSLIASLIVRYVCLGEREISKIITVGYEKDREKLLNNAKKRASIKLYILFFLSTVLTFICWYYVSAFCAVFKNSQKHYLVNTLISFIICNLWPAVTCWIPTVMRKKALENKNKTLYNASQIVAIF